MFTYDDFVVYLLFYAMMYIILLRNANISSILVIFRDGFSFFCSCFFNTEDVFFFLFLFVLLLPSHRERRYIATCDDIIPLLRKQSRF